MQKSKTEVQSDNNTVDQIPMHLRSHTTLEGTGQTSMLSSKHLVNLQPVVHVQNRTSVRCSHIGQKSTKLIGDAHLVNCNDCGAYYPKSGSDVLRAAKRSACLNKLYTSDILRTIYAKCQSKQQNKEAHLKISHQYVEVRNLIIDWLAEVCETLHLDIHKSAFHAVCILDRYLSNQLRRYKKEMDQSAIMLQALTCLFIAAKNLEKDPMVPSSRKFLRQLPGYKPTATENHADQAIAAAGMQALGGK